jgi:hypothetical protein
MQMMNIDCQEVASAEEVDARGWLNILWMSSMWLISASNGCCSIRHIMTLHRSRLQALIAELAPIAKLAHMKDFDHVSGADEDALGLPVRDAHVAGNDLLEVDKVMCDMEARSRQYLVGALVPCKQGALRQLQWLNGSHSPLSLCAHVCMRARAHTQSHTVMFEQELPAQGWIIRTAPATPH